MQCNKEKFKALVRYIAWKAGRRDWFGATKLNKVLWFADARLFVLRGEPITGATYIREKFGPVPREIMPIRAELKGEGYIKVFEEGGLVRITADAKPDMSAFTKDELQTIDYWIEHIDKDHPAGSISDASHDYAWDIARMGEELPFYAIPANRIRDPSNQESERFQTIAKAQGAL
jgi:antitoxin SocA-like protein